MEKRSLDSSRSSHQSLPRKCKRRSSRRDSLLLNALSSSQQNGDPVSGMEYSPRMLWQTNVPQNVQGNGQRLFAAMSDPSVCGYSPMPVTYTMQPVSLPPMYGLYQPMPLPNIGTIRGRHRRDRIDHSANICFNANNNIPNGCGAQQENGLESTVHIAHLNGDYASLPPTADTGINGDELNSEHRRYSDPGLGPAKTLIQSDSEDSAGSGSSITTIGRGNKLVLSLIEQITDLKKYNSQLFKELSVTKSYLENMTAKLVQCKHCASSDYQPGILSDLIREIREANKKCEEGLVTKVKIMLEEKHSQQSKEIEEIKNQLSNVIKEKEESERRITKLERELAVLKMSITNEGREIAAFEEETLALRRELQEARASRTLAENHAAKCVNFAISRSVTPVTFETPCITSTPVRTALTDTCSLLPISNPSVSHTSVVTSVPRPHSAEVAALLDPETAKHDRNGIDTGDPVSSERFSKEENNRCIDATSCYQLASISTNIDAANTVETSGNKTETQNTSESTDATGTLQEAPTWAELDLDYLVLLNEKEACDIDSTRKLLTTDQETEMKRLTTGNPQEQADDQFSRKHTEAKVKLTKDKAKTIVSANVQKERKDTPANVTSKERPMNHASSSKSSEFRNQRDSLKKSRRRKGNLRRSFSEADKAGKSSHQNIAPVDMIRCTNTIAGGQDRPNKEENCHSDESTSRAITDVPEVAVIGGGSFVPKDLCLTSILTSRVLTAPSRATYTTAYI